MDDGIYGFQGKTKYMKMFYKYRTIFGKFWVVVVGKLKKHDWMSLGL